MTHPYVFNSIEYLELEAERLGGSPIRIADGDRTEIRLIVRQIPGSNLRDGVSVYGYPDLELQEPVADRVEADRVLEVLRTTPPADGLVSAYFRLGLDQYVESPCNPSIARKVHIGDVVYVDLQKDWARIAAGFKRTLKTQLRRCDGIVVESSNDIATFHAIYTQNMVRVGASDYYLFSIDYMRRLLSLVGVKLFLARDSSGPLAGALVVSHGHLLFYHLGAATERGLSRQALKLLVSEVIREHAGGSFQHFVLGGGRGGESDSLLYFKRGFSKQMRSAYALKLILDNRSYAELSGSCDERDPFDGFFPAYRRPHV